MSDAALSFVTPAASAGGGNPIINMERTPMARHTTMPPRNQRTPHGDVTLTSRWKHDRYYLAATGVTDALRWMLDIAGRTGSWMSSVRSSKWATGIVKTTAKRP